MSSFTSTHIHFPASKCYRSVIPLSSSLSFSIPSVCRRKNKVKCSRRRRGIQCSVAKGPATATPSLSTGNSQSVLDCVIVGAGISGLCIAQALATKHQNSNIMVTEARDRVGGNITTVERDGYLWEEGPNSFQPSDPLLTMALDSGLKNELVLGDPNAPRFVLWNGKLRPVPSKPTDLPFFDLMSIPGKIRAGFGAIGLRPSPPGHEETVEEFVRRNLGSEVFERLIEPFCSGRRQFLQSVTLQCFLSSFFFLFGPSYTFLFDETKRKFFDGCCRNWTELFSGARIKISDRGDFMAGTSNSVVGNRSAITSPIGKEYADLWPRIASVANAVV